MAATIALVFAACNGDSQPSRTPSATTAVSATIAATTSPTASATTAPPQPLAWSDCDDGFECATIDVPRDYTQPSGGVFRLPLIRLPASDPSARIGSLLMNPGGPGTSGVEFVRRAAKTFFTEGVRDRFDIVGFDPRGVGGSDPAVDCVDDLGPLVEADPSPNSDAVLQQESDAALALVQGCEQRSGDILPYVSTANAVRDLDVMRAALGDDRLTYAGFSYGTLIGAMYADMFPQRVRTIVLDGAVDPALTPVQDVRTQILGFEDALDSFLADCSSDAECKFHSGGDAGAAFDALMADIETSPVPSDDGRTVGPGLAWFAVAASLYNRPSGWPALARALAQARDDHDSTRLASLSDFVSGRRDDGTYDNELEQRVAINCLDFAHLTPDETRALLAELTVSAPRFGPNSGLASKDPCDFWPVPPQRTPAPIAAKGAPPILVVGTTGDPATPYEQAVALTSQLQSGVLFTYVGEGHTAYGKGIDCVNETVDAYLIDLTVPAAGASC